MDYLIMIITGICSFIVSLWHLIQYQLKSEGYAYKEDIDRHVHTSLIFSAIGGIFIGASFAVALIA